MPLKPDEILYTDLRAELIDFKNASATNRQRKLSTAIASISYFDPIKDKDQAIDAYRRLAYAATLINYAKTLRQIDTQEYFDILIDFKMPDMFEKPDFVELKKYFEFHKTAPQMRLLQPRTEIPAPIWQLFRDAQKAKLKEKGKEKGFNLDELSLTAPLPKDQLYPLPIQMFGRYENQAVDRIWGDAQGLYTFANRYGVYLLPGGGMVEIDLERTKDSILLKMLEEHLQEEHGNLWVKAEKHYNQVNPQVFQAKVIECVEKFLTGLAEAADKAAKEGKLDQEAKKVRLAQIAGYKATLALSLGNIGDSTNGQLVQEVHCLLTDMIEDKTNATDKKGLVELRADIQVEPFKLTELYTQAADYVKSNSMKVLIEQFCDTRACGGKQMSNSYLMFGADLHKLFEAAFEGTKAEPGDDIIGARYEHKSLLQWLALFSKVKFSHLLIALAHQVESFERGLMQFETVWNDEQFFAAQHALSTGAEAEIAKIDELRRPAAPAAPAPIPAAAKAALVEGPGLHASKRIRDQAAAAAAEVAVKSVGGTPPV